MRALFLLLFTLLAGPAAAQDPVSLSGCKEDQADCRDECTVEYGGSTRTYDKLGACLQKCKQKYDKCRERQLAIQEQEKLKLAPESTPAAPPPGAEKPPEQSGSTSDGGVDGGSGPAPELDAGVPATSGPEPFIDTTELDLLFDEQQSPPPPPASAKPKAKAKAKAEPSSSKPPPESKKKDTPGQEPDAQ